MPESAVHVATGKVREIYELDDERLLLVASDRISTFDVVLPTEIPHKGRVLTGLSAFWFARTRDIVPNHLLGVRDDARSSEVRRLAMLPIECVVRGYIAGSGWKDYRATGSTSGHRLPDGLRESDRLPGPIFTPATKAQEGHDENIDRGQAADLVGAERLAEVERVSLELYSRAAEYAAARGIIIADTKFEFGLDESGTLVLGDEALTPDSSRFWPLNEYEPGHARLLREPRLGQNAARARAAGERSRRHARPVHRRVRAPGGRLVRGVHERSVGRRPMRATVLVRPKQGILDPQGQAVESSLRQLGFDVGAARVGRVIDLEIEAAEPAQVRAEVDRMCRQLLANPLIESYEIELEENGR
jgi:phosphoribosylaminoimidazole-succinocarboxamide synthase